MTQGKINEWSGFKEFAFNKFDFSNFTDKNDNH